MRTARHKSEILSRSGAVQRCRVDVHIHVQSARGLPRTHEYRTYLDILGELEEDVNGVRQISILVYPGQSTDKNSEVPASLGSITRVKPTIQAALEVQAEEFRTLVQMALADRLKVVHLAFHKPFRGGALIVAASFGTDSSE